MAVLRFGFPRSRLVESPVNKIDLHVADVVADCLVSQMYVPYVIRIGCQIRDSEVAALF